MLTPWLGGPLRITQQELAYLVGLSRQRVNEAPRPLHSERMIEVECGGVKVLDLQRLRRYSRGWARRRACKPSPAKPSAISAQVEGSGMAGVGGVATLLIAPTASMSAPTVFPV